MCEVGSEHKVCFGAFLRVTKVFWAGSGAGKGAGEGAGEGANHTKSLISFDFGPTLPYSYILIIISLMKYFCAN